jgi:ubiquinone/menaquinone biosynthesis C-methylase UbiE
MQPAASEHEVQGVDLSDKRGIERLPVRLMVADALRSAPLGLTRDLSVDGFFLQSEQRLPVGTMAPFSLTLEGGEELRVQAEVVRWASDGMGMRFGEMDRGERKRVRKVISGLASIDVQRRAAAQLHDPSTRTTEPVNDASGIRERLQQALEGRVDMRLFPSERPAQDDARMEALSVDRLVLKTKTGSLMKLGETVLVLMTLRYVSYSFASQVLVVEGRRVELAFPQTLAFSERRTREREAAPSGARLRVPSPWDSGQLLEWQVVDLGNGGVGVLASESFGALFPGTPLLGAMLEMDGRLTELDHAVVRNVRKVEQGNGEVKYRIGISCGVQRQAVVDQKFKARQKKPVTLFDRIVQKWGDLQNAVSYVWHTKVRPRATGKREALSEGTTPISFTGKRGLTIRGLMNRAFDDEAVPSCPVVLILPGFAGRKEQTSAMAHVLVDHFRRCHQQVVVIRLDGTNNLGESDKDAGCESEAKHLLHYTISGAAEDMLECLAWLRMGELVQPTDITVVSVSFSSVAVRHALATGRAPEVRRWVSWMGAADARDAVLHVSGYVDIYKMGEIAASRGVPIGNVTLMGCLVDAQRFYDDMHGRGIGTLEDARREMAQIGSDVLWMRGEHDAWMDPERIRDVMSIPADGSREVLTGDSGHMPQSGPEAVRQYSEITSWLQARLEGRSVPVRAPSLGWLKAMSDWEWKRVRRDAPISAAAFWQDYLLDESGPGFDILQHSPAYNRFMDRQATLAAVGGLRVLELGAGTGNLSQRLWAQQPASYVITDLVPEAAARLRDRYSSESAVTVMSLNIDGGPWLALDRYRRGELTGWRELFRRIPGLPADMVERVSRLDSQAVHAMLKGHDVTFDDLRVAANAAAATRELLRELMSVAKLARAGASASGPAVELQHLLMGPADGCRGLPFADASFDVVVLSLVLSYLEHPADAVAEIWRVLKPGGRLVMSTMRRDADSSKNFLDLVDLFERQSLEEVGSEERRQELIAAARRFLDRASDLFRMEEEGLYTFWDPEEFARLVRLGGFKDVTTEESFGSPPQAVIVRCHKPS